MGYFVGGHVSDASSGAALWTANVCATGTLNCVRVDTNGNWWDYSGVTTGTSLSVGAYGYVSKTYAVGVINATDGLGNQGNWTPISLERAPAPPDCCFTADTLIVLEDGSEKCIAEIKAGDKVLGDGGIKNTVIGIKIPFLDRRHLYSLNGGKAFVTAEHPFFTDQGWKSIDPAATYAEHANLVTGRLQPGDKLVKLAMILETSGSYLSGAENDMESLIEAESLFSIQPAWAVPNTKLYNLLLDGNHTYFANRYLVHNKGH